MLTTTLPCSTCKDSLLLQLTTCFGPLQDYQQAVKQTFLQKVTNAYKVHTSFVFVRSQKLKNK